MSYTNGNSTGNPNQINSQSLALKREFLQEVATFLGAGKIGIELDQNHYDIAYKRAFMRYYQKSSNAIQESFLFLDVQPDVSLYTLPEEVQDVTAIYRRSIGGTSGGAAIDPFSLAFTNNIYMIQNPGGLGTTGAGTLSTYEFAIDFQKLVGRMFGRDIMFVWDASTKKLLLERNITATEQVVIHVYNKRPDFVLLNDPYARIWLFDATLNNCRLILAEIRSKFASISGPQGGFSLNGDALRAQAEAEFLRLDKELETFTDSHVAYGIVVG